MQQKRHSFHTHQAMFPHSDLVLEYVCLELRLPTRCKQVSEVIRVSSIDTLAAAGAGAGAEFHRGGRWRGRDWLTADLPCQVDSGTSQMLSTLWVSCRLASSLKVSISRPVSPPLLHLSFFLLGCSIAGFLLLSPSFCFTPLLNKSLDLIYFPISLSVDCPLTCSLKHGACTLSVQAHMHTMVVILVRMPCWLAFMCYFNHPHSIFNLNPLCKHG